MTAPDLDIGAVAHRLLGKPTSASKTELRYGRKESLSISLEKNVWKDFDKGTSGGVLRPGVEHAPPPRCRGPARP